MTARPAAAHEAEANVYAFDPVALPAAFIRYPVRAPEAKVTARVGLKLTLVHEASEVDRT